MRARAKGAPGSNTPSSAVNSCGCLPTQSRVFPMNCPWCGSPGVYRHKIRQRMMELAQLPRPSIRGTLAAKERARKAALARWRQVALPEQRPPQEAAEAHSRVS
jgi:hypothetical protein